MPRKIAFGLALFAGVFVAAFATAGAQQSQLRQQSRQIQQTYRASQQQLNRQLQARRDRTQNYVRQRQSTRRPYTFRDIPYNWIQPGYVGILREMVPDVANSIQRQRRVQHR
jgi:hypothetical protein